MQPSTMDGLVISRRNMAMSTEPVTPVSSDLAASVAFMPRRSERMRAARPTYSVRLAPCLPLVSCPPTRTSASVAAACDGVRPDAGHRRA